MTSNLQFGIAIPQFVADGAFNPAAFRTYLARAETLGFDSAWAMEQVLGSTPFLSPIETMAYAAACTERLRLGCAVLVTPLHSPVQLTKSLATLDQLSRGRIDVGVATGGKNRPFSAFAVDPTSLVARFTEGLQLAKALWTEPRTTFDGPFRCRRCADLAHALPVGGPSFCRVVRCRCRGKRWTPNPESGALARASTFLPQRPESGVEPAIDGKGPLPCGCGAALEHS